MEAAAPEPQTESHGRPVERHRIASDEFFHLVFSNKTADDERALAIRAELIERAGLSIWQQQTNIPKDSDNWCEILPVLFCDPNRRMRSRRCVA